MCQVGDGLQVLMLVSESLTGGQLARVEVLSQSLLVCARVGLELLGAEVWVLELGFVDGHLSVVCQELLKVLGTQDADLGEQELTLDEGSGCVVQNCPDGDEILELSASLLHDAILTLEDNSHAREIFDFGVADDQTVDVETSGGQDTGHAGEHTGFVLDQTVQDMALWRGLGREWCLIENAGDSGGGRDGGSGRGGGQWVDAAVQGLVCDG